MINAVSRVYRSWTRRVGGVAAAAIDDVICVLIRVQRAPARGNRQLTKPLVCKLVSYKPLAFRGVERRLALCGSRPCSCRTDRETAWVRKTARAHRGNGRLSQLERLVSCNNVPLAACCVHPVFIFGQQRSACNRRRLRAPHQFCLPHSARHCFTLARAPLKARAPKPWPK